MYPLLRKHPLLLIVLVFIAGILSAEFFLGSPVHYYIISITFFVLSLALNSILRGEYIELTSLTLLLSLFSLSVSRKMQMYRVHQNSHFSNYLDEGENSIIGTVLEVNRNRFILRVDNTNRNKSRGKLSVVSQQPVVPGNRIFFDAMISEIRKPRNPFAFDFRQFYHHKQIWYQTYLHNVPLVLDEGKGFNFWMAGIRKKCDESLRSVLTTSNEYSLAAALILGDKRELGTEMKNAFADTGAMHVLAVSGLHVGVVYMILLYFFKFFFTSSFWSRIFRSLLIFAGLWFFVYLVGAPTSAWRAALMFSLFEGSRLMSRSYYPVNTLALAAFIMLLLDPNALYDVGFQLSFLAVLGIVTCQRPIQNWLQLKNGLSFRIWQMISLSLSAQIFTFPLTIFYFHQFPLYFWLSGILAVPLAFFILTTGLFFLLFSWVPLINSLLIYLIQEGASCLNGWIFLLEKLPGMVVEKLWISEVQLFILLGLSIVITVSLIRPTVNNLKFLLSGFIIFMMVSIVKKWHMLHQEYLIAYSVRSQQFIDLIVGQKAYSICAGNEDMPIPFDVENARSALGIKSVLNPDSNPNIFQKNGFLGYNKMRLYQPDSAMLFSPFFPSTDIVFLDDLKPGKFDAMKGKINICINRILNRNWLKKIPANFKLHDLQDDGALTINLKTL
ncbi:MAG: ComEC/Rec2 family competence protein [Saprospiraceae bacterium]|nr:ComEC/Rec2 family competence protein [Saprospiraceae bacterium]